MAYLKVKNRAISTLASGVSDVETSWTVATGEGSKFPTTGDFHLTCEDEIVKCTARSSDVLTVTRAQESTANVAHVAGKAVELRITAGVVENVETEIDTHTGTQTAGIHGSTDAATGSKLVHRDSNGRAKFAAPNASGDALIKGTRLTSAEMLDGTSNYVLTGQGASTNPVYQKAVYSALPFTDLRCIICGRDFLIEDELILKIVDIRSEDNKTFIETVPIHYGCRGK